MHQSVRFFTGQMIAFRASSTQTQSLLISKDPTCYFQDSDCDVHDDGYGDGPSLRDYDKCLPFGVFSSSAFIFWMLNDFFYKYNKIE